MADSDNILNFLREKFGRLEIDIRQIKDDVRILKDDVIVTSAILRRLDTKQDVLLNELRALYPQISDLRVRVEDLERR